MQFQHPWVFVLLLLLPLLAWWRKRQKPNILRFAPLADLQATHAVKRPLLRQCVTLLKWAAFVCCIIALARPQMTETEREYDTEGIDIVLALDISGSMQAEDFQPENRLAVAKEEAKRFIKGRLNDRIGLVVFARQSYTQCPLTLDYDVLTSLLNEVRIGLIRDGTAIGLAIANSVNRLRDSHAKSKVIILITDGENNSGNIDPITAAEIARTFGIKIYTIGVGRGGLVPFPIDDPLFGRRYIQAQVDIDEDMLKKIADVTQGLYFRARDERSLQAIYQKIDQLEKTELKVKEYTSYEELFSYALLPALVLLVIEAIATHTLFLKVP